ncbi:MAG: HAMP domain-containing protein [Planctomycetes bacterium]|nr:HAMP domain-containing protein [Planctomycetota bacterium]
MIKRRLFWKLFAGNLLLIAVIVSIVGILAYHYLNANYQRENIKYQQQLVHIARLHFLHLWPSSRDKIDSECKKMMGNSPIRLTVIAKDGTVLGDSQADPHTMENHKTDDRPEVLAALKGKSGRDIRSSETLGVKFRYFAEPISINGKIVGLVRIAMPIHTIVEGRRLIRNALLYAVLVAAAVAIIIGALLGWIWHRPLNQITLTARKIATGDLTAKANIHGSDELAQLAAALNEMRQNLASQIDTIMSQREHLSAVVENLHEGVIATNNEGHVILMNKSAADMLGVDSTQAAGKHLQELIRIPDLLETINQVFETDTSIDRQIEVSTGKAQRILWIHATKIAREASENIAVLIVLRDITEIARAAAMKADFVANASHELRTPIATLRTAVDSLLEVQDKVPGDLGKIFHILDRQINRLEEMTKDLLDLNIVESAKGQISAEQIELSSLVTWAKERFNHSAEEKSINLEIVATDPSFSFTSDKRLIQMIIQNLLDNAIKFTPAGGQVKCLLNAKNNHLLIQVSDTGCGIPPELHERIFERFFQVEPSRSGDAKSRGTGLGLAIVKHATERLGGKITLHSKPGKGTTITITIPVS